MRVFITIFYLLFSLQVFAQSDGTMPPAEEPPKEDPSAVPAEPASGSTQPTPTPTSTTPTAPVTTPAPSPKVTPTPKPKPNFTLTPVSAPVVTEPTNQDSLLPQSSNNFKLLAIPGALAVGLLGFFGLKLKNKKPARNASGIADAGGEKEEDSKCLNFKKLMEEKLNELTDLKSQLKNLIKDKTAEQIKQIGAGTPAGKLFVSVEETQKAYNKFKELYEKCITDFSLQKTTLLYLHKPKEKQILLASKKRTSKNLKWGELGLGKWNGVGGKLEGNESIAEGLIREVKEEIGVLIKEEDLIKVATLKFLYQDKADWNQHAHVFFVEKWEGEPTETEEMLPRWYSTDALPYEQMWLDDPHWLPKVIEGKKVDGLIHLNKEGDKIVEIKIDEI